MPNLIEIASLFATDGEPVSAEAYGFGHINDTYRVVTSTGGQYVLQRLNGSVMRDTAGVMENLTRVTAFLAEKIAARGGDPLRGTLHLVPLRDGGKWLNLSGDVWRMTLFITGTVTLQAVESPEDFYFSGQAFGEFMALLHDFPAETLREVIPRFHDTPDRYRQFEEAVAADPLGRAAEVAPEIEFVRERREFCSLFTDMQRRGELPLRVTHNDTKLNNVLLDERTHRPVAVIDLDTVMPGLSLCDFGDSIRFGASTAAEDETDLSKVTCSLDYFESYAKGYLGACADLLTPAEIEMLPLSGKMLTLECGMRFLADYINGDTYFKIARPRHNLDRARTQFKLVDDMEGKIDDMREIISRVTR